MAHRKHLIKNLLVTSNNYKESELIEGDEKMLVNRKNKWKSKLVSLSLATALMATAGAVGAASKSASLDGSSRYYYCN